MRPCNGKKRSQLHGFRTLFPEFKAIDYKELRKRAKRVLDIT